MKKNSVFILLFVILNPIFANKTQHDPYIYNFKDNIKYNDNYYNKCINYFGTPSCELIVTSGIITGSVISGLIIYGGVKGTIKLYQYLKYKHPEPLSVLHANRLPNNPTEKINYLLDADSIEHTIITKDSLSWNEMPHNNGLDSQVHYTRHNVNHPVRKRFLSDSEIPRLLTEYE